jgi:hypothetical protein
MCHVILTISSDYSPNIAITSTEQMQIFNVEASGKYSYHFACNELLRWVTWPVYPSPSVARPNECLYCDRLRSGSSEHAPVASSPLHTGAARDLRSVGHTYALRPDEAMGCCVNGNELSGSIGV